jgi:hypothetical protein
MVDNISQTISEHLNNGEQHLRNDQYFEARNEFKCVLRLFRQGIDDARIRIKARGGLNKANEVLSKQH